MGISGVDKGGTHYFVMAGLVPAIHVFVCFAQDVDARDKRGHDDAV
jgi:hypothetical protein